MDNGNLFPLLPQPLLQYNIPTHCLRVIGLEGSLSDDGRGESLSPASFINSFMGHWGRVNYPHPLDSVDYLEAISSPALRVLPVGAFIAAEEVDGVVLEVPLQLAS